MAAPAAVLSILVKANTGPATTGLMKINAQLGTTEKNSQKAARAIEGVAKAGLLLGGAAIAGGLIYAGKKAADFESQMSALGAVADATGKQMEGFRKQALKAGADTKFSALEAAAAQTELAKGGLSVRQIMRGGLRSALALAAAGEMDLAEAAEATVNAMKLFGLRGKDAMKVADGFATAANSTTADVSDFALALKAGGSAAKAAGLTFTETTATLEALAEGGIKGSDAGTSMKAMLTQLAAPTEKQQKMMRKLNLDFFDAEGKMKGVTEVSRLLQDRLKGLTEEQRLQAVKTIAGTDGMRALLALYDAGPQKMGKFQRELEKQGTAADTAKKKQDNLKGALENLQGSFETIAIKVGTALIPTLRSAADDLTGFANDIGRIVDRKDLDVGEKLQKSFELAKVRAQPWIDKLKAALEAADIPGMLGRLISAATPVIAEAMAGIGVVAVKSFVRGFLEADIWGRLAIAGYLFAKMGGRPAFLKMGTQAGAAVGAGMGTGMGTAMATGMGSAGVKGKLVGAVKGWGPTLALTFAAVFGPEIVKALQKAVDPKSLKFELPKERGKIGQFLANIDLNPLTAARENIADADEELRKFGSTAETQFAKFEAAKDTAGLDGLARQAERLAEKFPKAADELRGFARAIGKVSEKRKDIQATEAQVIRMGENVRQALRRTRVQGGKNWDEMVQLVVSGSRKMLEKGGENSKKTRQEIHKQFDLAARKVQTAMDRKVISVEEGTARLRELARKELKLYGISAGRVDVVLAKGPGGEQRPHQKGSYISEGRAVGDSVPAVLEKGEYVLNRNAVKKVGRKALDTLNYRQAPRFQQGGIVELLHPGNDPKGHGDHLHVAMSTVAGIVALGKKLQRMGWLVGEHPAFGGVAPGVHSETGYHPKGLAIDVNWPDPSVEAAKIRALLPMLGGDMGGLGRVFKGLDRVQLKGPLSVALDAGQGVLDRVHAAANKAVERAVAVVEGSEPGMSASGNGAGLMRAISKQRGWNFNDWWALDAAETGHGANLSNPTSTARLRGQFLDMNYGKYGPGSDPAQSPSMGEQIQSMAMYIAERYGNPTAAWAFHRAHNYYRLGGPVGAQLGLGVGTGRPDFYGEFTNPQNRKQRSSMQKLIKRIRTGDTRKIRKDAMRKVIEKARGVGLPTAMQRALTKHSDAAADFGEFADRAASLTDESGITEALQAEMDRRTALGQAFPDGDQQAMVDGMLGRVGGKSQLDWLRDQLESLFHWRNAIVRAEEKIVALREKITEAIKVAQAQLERVRENLKRDRARKDRLEDRLKELRKHPKVNKAAIKVTKEQLQNVTKTIGVREGVRDDTVRVLDALTGKRQALNTTRGEFLTSLEEVQGRSGPAGQLAALPADIGAMGGSIFDTRLKIAELTDKPIRVTAEAGAGGDTDTESLELLRQLLREANLRTAVSQAQYKVFKEMPTFATGGIVPGAGGAPRVIEAHAGEGVFTRDQMAAMGGGTGQIAVVVHDGAVKSEYIEVLAGRAAQRAMRTTSVKAQRGLPSRGGGLIG